jgi:hypothetical protein
MPNWGAEIPVTIFDRKPDFVGDDDVCLVLTGGTWYGHIKPTAARDWFWYPPVKAIRFLDHHPYYKENKMDYQLYIREEAARRLNEADTSRDYVYSAFSYDHPSMKAMCKALVEFGFKRPFDPLMVAVEALLQAHSEGKLSIVYEDDVRDALAKSLADQGYELVKVAK